MICILHGYLLEGSGSNLWTRSVIQALCRQGETIHLLCQENHPEIYDFISTVIYYHADGTAETIIEREVPYPGCCIMHKPYIGEILPVYVWDKYEEYSDVQPMAGLSDEVIEAYLKYNIHVMEQVVDEYNIKLLHANHAVLMSVVARRVSEKFSIPYAIMPHGSAIEYAVKKDKRFYNLAHDAFTDAVCIFVIGKELRRRVKELFPDIEGLEEKLSELHLGVDTSLFRPISRKDRDHNIKLLYDSIRNLQRGKKTEMSSSLREGLSAGIKKDQLMNLIQANADYNPKHTDYNIEKCMQSINWQKDKILLYVGRLISGKGIHSLVAALPFIIKDNPGVRLIIVGHGPLREPLEALLWALENGSRDIVFNIIEWGGDLEGSGHESLSEIEYYFEKLDNEGLLESYFESAEKYIRQESVIFTGYLTHNELRYLFPACDVAIFPSVVVEAGPLVFIEAMASGCFPIGTYFGGMAANIDSLSGSVPDNVLEWMKLSPDTEKTVNDIVSKVNAALSSTDRYNSTLRKISVEKYDWQNISKHLIQRLNELI
jgi:glycosyltransferase involved in cell wall biosynthesis